MEYKELSFAATVINNLLPTLDEETYQCME